MFLCLAQDPLVPLPQDPKHLMIDIEPPKVQPAVCSQTMTGYQLRTTNVHTLSIFKLVKLVFQLFSPSIENRKRRAGLITITPVAPVVHQIFGINFHSTNL
ncbi:hypothetical protein BASA81_015526 [Batrachochytrium salamandrivorans]|nr:hypothetical protein BASA81_015526 [Batrachochytrium salamandrivorans]